MAENPELGVQHRPGPQDHAFERTKVSHSSSHSRSSKRQTASTASRLIRTHSCLSPPRVLRRKSSGLPSATTTYTALRKAAAGGSQIPHICQANFAKNKQHTSQPAHQATDADMPSGSTQCALVELQQNALPSLALASLHQAPDTSHGSCTSQHDIAADELQWLWEEAQAAMQDSVPSTSDALSADQKQPPQQPVQSDMAALKFPLTAPSCSIKSETTMAGELSQDIEGRQRKVAGHHQRVLMADKQVQAGGSLERAPKQLRSNSQNGMLQTSPSMRSMRPILGETTLNMLELSKIIKHLQAQLDQQESLGASLEGQLAAAHREVERLQAFEAGQQEIIEQAQLEGVEIGRQELAQERFLKHKLEKALARKLSEQQAAADKEVAAAMQTASHVTSLQQHIQELKSQNEATLKSKLKGDHRNMDLQRRHDALNQDAQHTQRALACSQEEVAALEDRLHVLRRVNSQLDRSESHAQQRSAHAQQQVTRVEHERKLLVTMLQDQADSVVGTTNCHTSPAAGTHVRLQHSILGDPVLAGSLRQRFTKGLPCTDPQHAEHVQPSQPNAESSPDATSPQGPAMESADQLIDSAVAADVDLHAQASTCCQTGDTSGIPAVGYQRQVQQISRGMSAIPVGISEHALKQTSAGMVARRKDNLYNEQKAYWHRKEALCPNIKNCIQEVQQLRAQLSQEALFVERPA